MYVMFVCIAQTGCNKIKIGLFIVFVGNTIGTSEVHIAQ